MRKLKGTREAVLYAAVNCFAEKGFYGTTIREIGAACDVTDPTIYHYFHNKEDLFRKTMIQMHYVYFLVLESVLIRTEDFRTELTSYFFGITEWGKNLAHGDKTYIEMSIAHVQDFFHSTPSFMKSEFQGRFHKKFCRLIQDSLVKRGFKDNLKALVTYYATFIYGFTEKIARIDSGVFSYEEIADAVEQFMQFIFRTQKGLGPDSINWELSAPSRKLEEIQSIVQRRLREYPHKIFSFKNFGAYIRYGHPT